MRGLPWWSKVQAHIRAEHITYAMLGERTGLSERTLRRWIGRPDDADPRQGPAGEIHFLQVIAKAVGWPTWYLANDHYGYPPPEALVRLNDALEALPADRRDPIVRLLALEMTDLLTLLVERYDDVRGELRARWQKTLDRAAPPD